MHGAPCAILQSLGLLAAIHLSKYASWSGTVSQSLIAFGTYHPSSFDKHPRDPGPNIMTLLCFLENPDLGSVGLHRIVGV
jgi:hypothetical protein